MKSVVVVGAGIAGASVAVQLAVDGADVVVVEADRPGRATRAGAGIVPAPTLAPASPLEELRSAAAAAYPGAAADAGGASFAVVGDLHVARVGKDLEIAAETLTAAHGTATTVLAPGEANGLFPYLDHAYGAVRVAGTARVDGEAMRAGLLRAAEAAGARFAAGEAALDDDGRVVRVGRERFPAEAVVLAAGAWSADLAAAAGVVVPVEAQRGQIAHFGVPDDTVGLPVVQPLASRHYLLAFDDRRIVAGATRETGSGPDPRMTAAGVAEVLRETLLVAPGLADATLQEVRVGLRPATPDLLPLLGPVPGHPTLWLATGMGAGGLALGPYAGRLVARAIAGADPEIDLAPFGLGRFSGGQL